MRVTVDLGFWSLVLVALLCVVLPATGLAFRRWLRRAAARAEEIKRRLVLAEEETVRAETEAASYQYGAVSAAKNKLCAMCYCPTTTRCARCKAVHYCSAKCQIVHWRQGHKDKCCPPSPTFQNDDLVNDIGKKVAEPDHRTIHDERSQIESTEYRTSSEKPLLSDISCSPDISSAKDDNVRVESLQVGNIKGSNSELSSNSFSGFSASTGASESSDDSSVSESRVDASSVHNLQTVCSRASNHVAINHGSTLKSAESRCLPHAFADTKLVSRTEEHSHYSTKYGNNGIQSGTATSSQVVSCSPNSKNDLKTSVPKVSDQFRGSKLSKPFKLADGSDITAKYSDKGLFPYDLFVRLYNWNRVELQPFGLVNCGNSCYANAVLQCLAFTPPLTAYWLQGFHSKSCANKKWCFTCELESLILKSKDTKSPVSPESILSELHNNGSQLGNGREEDAHEFLRLAVETMQSVCLIESGDNTSDSLKEETNLMGLTFGGHLQSKIKCMKCGGKSERQERMMDLTVEIEGEIATLEEALRQFTSAETLDGENKYHCISCKSYEKAKKKMTVLEAPNVLTIALKRFQSGKYGKLNKPIRFPEILDLAPFMSGTSDLPIYRLYGVVVHLDIMNDASSGHYVSYVKNFQSKWFKVDDSVVTAVELESVLAKGAYMLFYARCSPRAPRVIRNSIISSDSKWKLNGKTVTMKSRRVSAVSGAGECITSLSSPDGSLSLDTIYSKFHQRKRILEEDSSSDNSSLLSSNSDVASCSTDSTCDSTSTDDFADYIFGDSGRGSGGMLRNSDSNIFSALPSSPLKSIYSASSDMDPYDSVLPHSTGFQTPPSGPKVGVDGLLYSRLMDVKRSGESVPHFRPDTNIEHRKLDTSRSSSSFRETDSIQRAGSNHFNDRNSGVSCLKSRDRTD
uniref:ubiquitinyl hydrolase 1 n=1 Tax=Cajanus cajan TaxID=3821 RepID=A0A151RXH4_CAJCA|nr:Ubiquitin carboxyl-terminal hydrolase 17 [Cajanus cajan]